MDQNSSYSSSPPGHMRDLTGNYIRFRSTCAERIRKWNLPLLKVDQRTTELDSGWKVEMDTQSESSAEKSEKSVPSSESIKEEDLKKVIDSADVKYLKEVVGKPLRKAMAEIVLKHPSNPVGYLGHWLLNFRYDHERNQQKREEFANLLQQRKEIEAEKLHKIIKEESKNVLNTIVDYVEDNFLNEFEYVGAFAKPN